MNIRDVSLFEVHVKWNQPEIPTEDRQVTLPPIS
jgi:hypothetical protein